MTALTTALLAAAALAQPDAAAAPARPAEPAALVQPETAPDPDPIGPSLPGALDPSAALPTALASVLQDEDPRNEWNGNFGLGINFTDGNSRTMTGNASGDAQYRRERDRVTLKFLWTYKDDKDVAPSVVDRKTFLSGQYDYFISEQTFLFGRLQGQADLAAELKLRSTVAAGAGRQFVDGDEWKFRGEAGLSYIDENYYDDSADDDYVAGALSYSAAYIPNEKWDFAQDSFWYPAIDDIHQMTARVDTRGKYLMSDSIYAQMQWIWDWTRSPQPGSGPSDHTVLLSLGWAF